MCIFQSKCDFLFLIFPPLSDYFLPLAVDVQPAEENQHKTNIVALSQLTMHVINVLFHKLFFFPLLHLSHAHEVGVN